ncbi:MAG: SAP domain-containing protein [Candidatus Poseidoniaceae archaeon]
MSEDLSFKVDYSKLTKEQLKQLCEQNGLKKSGNKTDLLERLNQLTEPSAPKIEKKKYV